MNIINKLTLRQLLLNKKRTLVTIIGTIISAAMITAVATLGLSFMDVLQRQSIAADGEWHVKYKQINKQQLEAIEKEKHVKTAMINRATGYAKLEGSKNKNKPYLYIMEFSPKMFEHMPVKLVEGRYPQKPNEIILSEAVIKNAGVNYKIGDEIKLSTGERHSTQTKVENKETLEQNYELQWEDDEVAEKLIEKKSQTYTVVGIIERPEWEYTWAPGYTSISYLDENTVLESESFDVSVIFNKVNNKLFSWGDKIAKENGIDSVGYNNDLLRYYGIVRDDEVKSMLTTLSAIIMVIIMIGSVSLIYNAFAISVSERSRYLGMLSSVGATKKQKRNSVFFEGAIIGAVSIPLGILAGYLGLGITYIFINPMILGMLKSQEGFRLVVYPSSVFISVLVSGLTILISTYIPARKASNVSAIDAIRQVSDVKISRKQLRTSIITRKLFGIEGELGLKNLKRYKARYKATVFSLVISMVLFLVVSSFTGYLKKSLTMTQVGVNYDIQVRLNTKMTGDREGLVQKIKTMDDVTASNVLGRWNTSTYVDEKSAADFLKEEKGSIIDGKFPYQVSVIVMDDENLEKYAKKIGVRMDKMTDTDTISCAVVDTITYKDEELDKYIEDKVIKTKVGNDITLVAYNSDTDQEISLAPVKIASLTKELPMGVLPVGKSADFYIVMSMKALNQLIKGNEKLVSEYLNISVYLNSDQPLVLQEKLEKLQDQVGVGAMSIYNVYYYKQSQQQSLLLVSVFTYAFIILITAICIANIINTISTSIALRKREFAMLKSIGITPKGFNKMLNYESIFYGVKALIYGLPISIFVIYLIYDVLMGKFEYAFILPTGSIIIVIIAVFLIVIISMLYSSARVRKENIIDALKQEII